MTERFSRPTPSPGDLAARPRPERVVPHPAPVADHVEQLLPHDRTWDREAFERSLRYSRLHPLARLVGFMLAHFAERAPNTGTGRIPASCVPELKRLAVAAGIEEKKARSSLNALEHGGWIIRQRHAVPHRASITLTIPAGQPQPRAR